jgi:hypothetical protein
MVSSLIIFHVFEPSAVYCKKCRRAMITPVAFLIIMALGILSIAPLRFFGLIR